MGEAFAMTGIAAARHRQPEPMRQLLRRDVAPGEADVAFIFEFVVDDRACPIRYATRVVRLTFQFWMQT